MRILITGSSKGIGKAVSLYFIKKGFKVIGIDMLPQTIFDDNYTHYELDIRNKDYLPELGDIEYIFNNAGLQNSEDDIENNLKGSINITEKYAFNPKIKSVLFNASASSRSGFEFPEYVASKAGLVGYMKNVAVRLAKQKAIANSISLGGVITESNEVVMNDKKMWKQIMDATPLKKWMKEDEVCDWVYFLLVVNKSMSGQDILIDNGEYNLNSTFIWPKD